MSDVYSFSAKGKRENNEDFILTQQLSPDCSLHLVADGMGELPLWPDDVIIICSDGLWRNVHVPSLVGLTKDSMNDQLITFENSMEDNYSVIRILT